MSNFRSVAPWLFLPLLMLTAALFLLVQAPGWEYQPVQSLQVFSNLPLFWSFYTLWVLLLLVLLWKCRSLWWGAALVVVFVLVHVGVFVLATPYGVGEDWKWSVDPVQIQHTGRLDFSGYRDFPGLAVLRAFLSSVTGVEVFALRTPLLLSWLVVLPLLLVAGYSKLFKNIPVAILAVMFTVQSNVMVARLYAHPQYMGIMLLGTFLALLWIQKGHASLGMAEKLPLVFVMGAVTMSHFVGSMITLVTAVGVYLEQRRRGLIGVLTIDFIILGLIMVLAWGIYWAISTFSNLAGFLPNIEERLLQGLVFQYPLRVARANTAPMPFWVTGVQMIWLITIYLFATFLALRNLLKKESAASRVSRISMPYVILVGAWGLAAISEPTGSQGIRFILYGSFLAAPIVIYFFLEECRSRLLVVALSGMFLVLSFPTMLAHNTNIGVSSRQPSEVAAGKFLSRAVAELDIVKFKGIYYGIDITLYYSPELIHRYEPFVREDAVVLNVEELQSLWLEHVSGFLLDPGRASETILVFNQRELYYAQFMWGMGWDHPMWGEVRQLLSQADRFFDSGKLQTYH